MSGYMRHTDTPFDDTVQLSEVMPSHQQSDDDPPLEETNEVTVRTATMETTVSKCRAYGTVAILLFVNLLNYMDRFTIAGKLLKPFYHLLEMMLRLR